MPPKLSLVAVAISAALTYSAPGAAAVGDICVDDGTAQPVAGCTTAATGKITNGTITNLSSTDGTITCFPGDCTLVQYASDRLLVTLVNNWRRK